MIMCQHLLCSELYNMAEVSSKCHDMSAFAGCRLNSKSEGAELHSILYHK